MRAVKMAGNNEIDKYYSEWWENPQDIRNVVFNKLNEYVRRRIPPGKREKALDIGSGHGTIVSYLVGKGYEVAAVEFNEEFVKELGNKFPSLKVIAEDVRQVGFDERYDLTTCIELVQNLNKKELADLLTKLAKVTKLLLINISNRNSFHCRWVGLRGWRNKFVFDYTPKEFEQLLAQAGFDVAHRRGIGLITPVSLSKGFRRKLVPIWLARVVNKLDPLVPKICHLYYVEAISRRL